MHSINTSQQTHELINTGLKRHIEARSATKLQNGHCLKLNTHITEHKAEIYLKL